MKRRNRTLLLIVLAAMVLGAATIIGAIAMKKTVSFFYAPQDVAQNPPKIGAHVRLGGLVKAGSVVRGDNGKVQFVVTDGIGEIKVDFQGIVPDLFREGQGVIAEGQFVSMDSFKASNILAKHDENYVPKEVADSLKKSGQWKGAAEAVTEGGEKK